MRLLNNTMTSQNLDDEIEQQILSKEQKMARTPSDPTEGLKG
jgi:hypothetical protein